MTALCVFIVGTCSLRYTFEIQAGTASSFHLPPKKRSRGERAGSNGRQRQRRASLGEGEGKICGVGGKGKGKGKGLKRIGVGFGKFGIG